MRLIKDLVPPEDSLDLGFARFPAPADSPCGKHRLWLARSLEGRSGLFSAKDRAFSREDVISWIMFNSSTATRTRDDPTIKRVQGFSRRAGFKVALVGNLFTYRTPSPAILGGLWNNPNPVPNLPQADAYLSWMFRHSAMTVLAWGSGSGLRNSLARKYFEIRSFKLINFLRMTRDDHGGSLYCLGRTRNGQPKHPLYLPSDTPFEFIP